MTNRNRVRKALREKGVGKPMTIGQIVAADPSGKLDRPKTELALEQMLRTDPLITEGEDGSWTLGAA